MNVTAYKSGKSGAEEFHWGGHEQTTVMIAPTHRFCTVVFLLATPPALTPLSTYSATHARQNTVIHRAEAWRGGGGWTERPCLKNYS